MALYMIAQDLTSADVMDPSRQIAFPDSVVSMLRGEQGRPADGFPPAIQRRVLGDRQPVEGRPGASLPPVDIDAERTALQKAGGRAISDCELASALLYPKVFKEYAAHLRQFGDVSVLPTPMFFYG